MFDVSQTLQMENKKLGQQIAEERNQRMRMESVINGRFGGVGQLVQRHPRGGQQAGGGGGAAAQGGGLQQGEQERAQPTHQPHPERGEGGDCRAAGGTDTLGM